MAQATATSTSDLWSLVHEQRDRVGDVLATLNDQEWLTQSLCDAWNVREVAAHCIETQLMTPPVFISRFAGSGFQFHKMSAKNVARHAGESTAELLQEYRATAHCTTAPPGPKVTWLGEAVIHGEDIARPTKRHIDVAPAALTMVADYVLKTTPLLHGKERGAGLKLRATDIEWSAGEGPEVSGPAASLIIALAGRKAGLDDLSGEGLETLRSRM
jgi:uncharacterized protein (TIGR03083 family)